MAEENSVEVDLWGDPWTQPRDARGRKRHRRVPQIAEKVALLSAAGMNAEDIAARSGISAPTLRKYYFRELSNGTVLAKAALLEVAYGEAKKGKISAATYVRDEIERAEFRTRREDKPEKIGKKAAAEAEAHHAHEGTEWGSLLRH
jgi:hypothetical protein